MYAFLCLCALQNHLEKWLQEEQNHKTVKTPVAFTINQYQSYMMPQELSVSDATIWSVTLKLSITSLEASFALIHDAYSTGIAYDDHPLRITLCL
jgi:hypothetical protein